METRQIKFRYFDPENKVMVYEDMPLPSPTWILHNRMEEPYGSYILTQFTGLLDKEEKEIYENDILDTESGVCVVVWYERGACFRFSFDGGKNLESPLNYDNVSILGNIYEHDYYLTN